MLDYTGADGVMIGRAAQGRPWIFQEIEQYLKTGIEPVATPLSVRRAVMQNHVKKLHRFYGKVKGVWYARKHVAEYVRDLPAAREFLQKFNSTGIGSEQLQLIQNYFDALMIQGEGAIAA